MPDTSAPVRPKQARSIARQDALIEYGAQLFNRRDLDEVSVAEITQGLGYSTGSFYSYFQDKAEMFVAVQTWVAAAQDDRLDRVIPADAARFMTPEERLSTAIDFALTYFREHTGLIRAALRYERRIPQSWAPNRRSTEKLITRITEGLDEADTVKLQTAIQLGFGLMVNTVLHDPGPLRLHDPDLSAHIVAALTPYLNTKGEP
jgi:AcrR family transcriptional regulator